MDERYKVPEECARCGQGPDYKPLVPPVLNIDEPLYAWSIRVLCEGGRAEYEATGDQEGGEAGQEEETRQELKISDREQRMMIRM